MSELNNQGVFGSAARSEVLMAIYLLDQTYPRELARLLGKSLTPVQKSIEGLERAGLVATWPDGAARRVTLNPRYVALKELRALLQALTIHEVELQDKLAQQRRRPRRIGKEIA
jgi:DNA-binding MarR family transcriptional regulator